MTKSIALLALALTPLSVFAEATTYTVDPAHSSVGFTVRHLVSKVKGNFGEFAGTITLDPQKPEASSATGDIKVASVNTSNEKRDGHLKGDDFFKADKNPTITFKSTSLKPSGEPDTYVLTGDLTFAGATKPVTLKLVKTGETTNPMTKGKVAGFEATGTLNRSDWGMTYGKGLVGDEVTLAIEIEAAVSK